MSSVKIGSSFFSNERRVYRDFVTAFWRELIQNSVDANSSRIDIRIEEGTTTDTKKVTITDNGIGMTRDILENTFLILGETTKTNNGSVGGFGKAKILICFAQKSYILRTNNIIVTGEGADYTITEGNEYRNGVQLEIEVFHMGRDLETPLHSYLKDCHLQNCHVYVNGTRHEEWTYRNKMERRLSFGTVYTNQSRKNAAVLVRVNGIQMFSVYLSAPFLIIIEIDKERSREVLQASRDGLLYQYQSELESFVNELNINKQSALREKRSKSIKYKGTGTFKSRRSKSMTATQYADQLETLLAKNSITLTFKGDTTVRSMIEDSSSPQDTVQRILKTVKEQGHTLDTSSVIQPSQLHSSGQSTDNEEYDLDFELFNVIVEDRTTNPKVRKTIESFYPSNWDLQGKNGYRFDKRLGKNVSFRAGADKYKLLVLWKAACEYCIRLMQDELQNGEEEIAWGVGWCFNDMKPGDHGLAMWKYEDGINWLMINPVNPQGTMSLSITDKRDLVKIISSAAHEVCHIIADNHDEIFANLLTSLMEECMADLSGILTYMKESKEAAVQRLDRLALV